MKKLSFILGIIAGVIIVITGILTALKITTPIALQGLEVSGANILLLVKELDENVLYASRNIPNLMVVKAEYSSTLDLVSSKYLVIETGAVESLNKAFDKSSKPVPAAEGVSE